MRDRRLDEWIKGENQTQSDSFIENIPIPETKNYIKKVINFYFLYSMIYTGQFKMSPCTFKLFNLLITVNNTSFKNHFS